MNGLSEQNALSDAAFRGFYMRCAQHHALQPRCARCQRDAVSRMHLRECTFARTPPEARSHLVSPCIVASSRIFGDAPDVQQPVALHSRCLPIAGTHSSTQWLYVAQAFRLTSSVGIAARRAWIVLLRHAGCVLCHMSGLGPDLQQGSMLQWVALAEQPLSWISTHLPMRKQAQQ